MKIKIDGRLKMKEGEEKRARGERRLSRYLITCYMEKIEEKWRKEMRQNTMWMRKRKKKKMKVENERERIKRSRELKHEI